MHGMVQNLTKETPPRNALPQWVREAAAERGYGDAKKSLGLYVTTEDVDRAFAEARSGDGNACVMAQAGQRLGAKAVYFYRTRAWVDFGEGPIVRYSVPRDIYRRIVEPFDRGAKEDIKPGLYHLTVPIPAHTLPAQRKRDKESRRNPENIGTGTKRESTNPKPYMGRVVMAHEKSTTPHTGENE